MRYLNSKMTVSTVLIVLPVLTVLDLLTELIVLTYFMVVIVFIYDLKYQLLCDKKLSLVLLTNTLDTSRDASAYKGNLQRWWMSIQMHFKGRHSRLKSPQPD